MRSHYGFESSSVCPASGRHEKGGVEGEVGRFRRRHLVPVPTSSRWSAERAGGQRRRAGRPPPHRVPAPHCGQHFASEQPQLLALPTSPSRWSSTSPAGSTPRPGCVSASPSTPSPSATRPTDRRALGPTAFWPWTGRTSSPGTPGARQRGPGTRPRPLPGGPPHQAGALAGQRVGAARKAGAFTPIHQRFWTGQEEARDQEGTEPSSVCCCSTARWIRTSSPAAWSGPS